MNQIEWILESHPKSNCSLLGGFNFEVDGDFIFREYDSDHRLNHKSEGVGAWRINDNNDLEIEFSNGKIDKFIIRFLSKTSIVLKKTQ